jgi:hypothetical protein
MLSYDLQLILRNMKEQMIHKDVPITSLYMQEAEGLVIMGNCDDVEYSWGSGRFLQEA